MNLRDSLKVALQSLNPNKHRDLVKIPFLDLVEYFFFLFFIGLLASVVVLAPMLFQYQNSLQSELSEFGEFKIDIDASLDSAITILEKPEIVIDFGREKTSGEFILATNESVFYKEFIFFGEEEARFDDYQSVKSDKSTDLYSKVVIFLLPAVVFWVAVLFMIKHLILIGLFSFLGWVFFVSSKNHITLRKSMKVGIFAATPMILLDLVLWPITIMYFIPIILYIIYFFIGIVMVSERKYGSKENS